LSQGWVFIQIFGFKRGANKRKLANGTDFVLGLKIDLGRFWPSSDIGYCHQPTSVTKNSLHISLAPENNLPF